MAKKENQFQLHQGKDGQWYGRLKAINGEIVWQTEGYTRRQNAKAAIFILIGIVTSAMYEIVDSETGELEGALDE